MDTNWRTLYFNKDNLQGVLINKKNGKIKVMGELKETVNPNSKLMYWAANPHLSNSSFSGSGLPYANPEQAYDRSPNVGVVTCKDRKFEFTIKYPNSYYMSLGAMFISPHIHIKLYDGKTECKYDSIKIDNGLTHRTLNSNEYRLNPNFYNNRPKLPFRSQEQILIDSSFKNSQKHKDFWGLKPAV